MDVNMDPLVGLDPQQFDRLPVYARRELNRLAGRLARAEAAVAAQPAGNCMLNPNGQYPVPLGDDVVIRRTGDRVSWTVRFLADDTLEVTKGGDHRLDLAVMPVVSNAVTLRAITD